MDTTPIFDQLVDEFHEKNIFIEGLFKEKVTNNTLYDATHLKPIQPRLQTRGKTEESGSDTVTETMRNLVQTPYVNPAATTQRMSPVRHGTALAVPEEKIHISGPRKARNRNLPKRKKRHN